MVSTKRTYGSGKDIFGRYDPDKLVEEDPTDNSPDEDEENTEDEDDEEEEDEEDEEEEDIHHTDYPESTNAVGDSQLRYKKQGGKKE